MQEIEEVVSVLNQMIESITKFDFFDIEKPKPNITETGENFVLNVNEFSANCSHHKTPQEDPAVLKSYSGNCEENAITTSSDFVNVCAKSSSPPNGVDLDEVVNNDCNIYPKIEERLKKDVLVQTISHSPAMRDSYCQCNLILEDDFTFAVAEHPCKKKLKQNTDGCSCLTYKKAHWQLETSELAEAEHQSSGNKTNYSDGYKLTSYLKKTSRIRVGLSKRFKLRN